MIKGKYNIYYFTASYPYGLGETWKTNELNVIKDYFEKITVIPYSYHNNFDSPKKLPDGVLCLKPLFETDSVKINIWSVFKLLDRNAIYYFKEFFKKKVYRDKNKIISWLSTSIKTQQLLGKPIVKDLLQFNDPDLILCFFWGKGSCDFLPFLKKGSFKKIIVRFHSYDLIEYENNDYIPYRRQLLESIDLAATSSQYGVDHLLGLYPDFRSKIQLVRLGVLDCGLVNMSQDKILRIVSCSYIIPVKRVAIIAESLKYLDFPVEWTHIGDGSLLDEVKIIVRSLPSNIKVYLQGIVDANELMDFYKQREFDLFINVSISEGVAMSILECMSLGIPIFATQVGGSGEVVDDTVGKILPKDVTPILLADKIKQFYFLSSEEKSAMKKAARERFEKMVNVATLSLEFTKLISE